MYKNAFSIVKNDADDYTTFIDKGNSAGEGKQYAVYVGGTGNVVMTTALGNTLTFSSVAAGTVLPVLATRILNTTTATELIALTDESVDFYGALSGLVLLDDTGEAGEGEESEGDTGVEGVTVTVTTPAGKEYTTETDEDGAWEITGMRFGPVTVTFDLPDGHEVAYGDDEVSATVPRFGTTTVATLGIQPTA